MALTFVELRSELRRRRGTHDPLSVRLTNADFVAKADFYFD